MGAALPLAVAACEAPTAELAGPAEAPPPDAGAAAADATVGVSPDAGAESADAEVTDAVLVDAGTIDAATVDAGASVEDVVVAAGFSVVLYDPTCSRHEHVLRVVPRTYAAGTTTRYLGGSHTVELRPDEIARLEAGEALAFATVGDGPIHGHCGLAYRADRVPPDRPRELACVPGGTAMCIPR